ncbi:MAG TPA: stalk domain-containing protein [Candidatus Aquicultor sp.]|jgi:hypothetical protein
MSHKARFIILVSIALIAVLSLSTAAYAVSLSTDEQTMLNLVNKERRANGLNPLEIDPKLELMARRYSQEMIDHNFFSHTSPVSGQLLDRVTAAGVEDGWLLAGENLAGAPTVEAAFEGLMNSPSHKENMLEPKYTHAGIGVVDGGPYGKMFTQEFVAYPKSGYFMSNNPAQDVLVYINDKLLYSDPPAFINEGRAYVPIRQFFEELGSVVQWDSEHQQIAINHPGVNILLAIGNSVGLVNDQPVILDTAPTMKDNRTFVPLRFVAESLGADVKWDNKLHTIEVTTKEQPQQ